MDWKNARRLLERGAVRGMGSRLPREERFGAPAGGLGPTRASSLCVASGKGGTGKSVVCASLGALLSRRGRTLIVDADLGVGNAHILQDVTPGHSFIDIVEGRLEARDARVPCREGLDLLAAGSGVSRMAGLSSFELHLVACGIEDLEPEYSSLVVDSAAGISNQTLAFASASDVVLLVSTPDVTALTDAYAFLKVLVQRRGDCVALFAVNRAACEAEAEHVAERFIGASRKFLSREPRLVGWLPEDPLVTHSVNHRVPAVLADPAAPFARALARLCDTIAEELGRVPARGMGRMLLRSVGYTPER